MKDIIKDAKADLEKIVAESVNLAKAEFISSFTSEELTKLIKEGMAEEKNELVKEEKDELEVEKPKVMETEEVSEDDVEVVDLTEMDDDQISEILNQLSEDDDVNITEDEIADDESLEEAIKALSEELESEVSEGLVGKHAIVDNQPHEIVKVDKATMKYTVKDKDGKEKEVPASSVTNVSEEDEKEELSEGLVGKHAYINGEEFEILSVDKAKMTYTVKGKDGKEKVVSAKEVGNISEEKSADMELSEDDLMEALNLMKEEDELEESASLVSKRKSQAGVKPPQNLVPKSGLESKMTGVVAENKKLKTENKKLVEENKLFVQSYKELKNKLSEMAVFNTKLAHVNDIFITEAVTASEKEQIIKRFDKVKTIDESKKVYKEVLAEVKKIKSENAKSIEEAIQKNNITEQAKVKIEEKVGFSKMTDLVERMNKVIL